MTRSSSSFSLKSFASRRREPDTREAEEIKRPHPQDLQDLQDAPNVAAPVSAWTRNPALAARNVVLGERFYAWLADRLQKTPPNPRPEYMGAAFRAWCGPSSNAETLAFREACQDAFAITDLVQQQAAFKQIAIQFKLEDKVECDINITDKVRRKLAGAEGPSLAVAIQAAAKENDVQLRTNAFANFRGDNRWVDSDAQGMVRANGDAIPSI